MSPLVQAQAQLQAHVLVDARAQLGECALWDEREQALWWTDIDAAQLWRWNAANGQLRHWTLPQRVGSFALCERPGLLLLGLASGVALFNLHTNGLGPLTPVPAAPGRTRINDGRCDPQGRFVFGMFNESDDGQPIGHFYRVGPDLQLERLPLPAVAVANSLAFSPDGATVYFTDSPRRQILCADYHADGRLGTPRCFAQLGPTDGFPDGSAVDAEGHLWTALWGAGCVVRFNPGGRETLRIAVPARHPTCPAFGGAALERLFVSSARKAGDAHPNAGAVFVVHGAGRGRPEHRFRTALHA